MMNAMPAAPWWDWMLWIALVRIVLAAPGATAPRLLISDYVTDLPTNPRTDTMTISIGKIARTP